MLISANKRQEERSNKVILVKYEIEEKSELSCRKEQQDKLRLVIFCNGVKKYKFVILESERFKYSKLMRFDKCITPLSFIFELLQRLRYINFVKDERCFKTLSDSEQQLIFKTTKLDKFFRQ